MSEAIHQLTPGHNFNGRYYVSRCIGAGGMGSVYEAVHAETHGKVALKVMLPRLVHREDMRRRFLQEAQVTARIPSDHIVRVFDAGVDDVTGMPFIVMELLEGEDLDALLTRAGRLEPHAVVTLLTQAALALDKTHEAGVVHRDLKPHNVFISRRDDGTPCVKILDFGIAKLIDGTGGAQRTRSAGTPVYMPPEQVRGEGDIDAAADAYALAHIAYAMLVGHPYWETEATELGLGPFIECVFRGPSESATARAARCGVQLPYGFDAWFARAAAADKRARIMPASALVAELALVFGLSADGNAQMPFPSAPQPFVAQHGSHRHPPTPSGLTTPGTPHDLQMGGGLTPFTPVPRTPPPAATTSGIVATSTDAGSRRTNKPLWFAVGAMVVLASVAVGSLITHRLVVADRDDAKAVEDDDATDSRSRKKKKGKKKKKEPDLMCPFERCTNVNLDADKPVSALKYLKDATKLARNLDSDAELVMISIGETIDSKIVSDSTFSLVYMYRYPLPGGKEGEYTGIQIILNQRQMMGRRTAGFRIGTVAKPRCDSVAAYKAAFADGMSRKRRTSAVYMTSQFGATPHWLMTQTGADLGSIVRYVNGVTCEIFKPY